MEFKKAYEALKQGALIKCPEWAGYWKWEDNSIKMHCKDGRILDIRETENVDYTLNFILRDDWEIVGEADVFRHSDIHIWRSNSQAESRMESCS